MDKLKLSEVNKAVAIRKAAWCIGLFFVPFAQLYSALIALPIFGILELTGQSKSIGYTFAFFYPTNIPVVFLFVIYYFVAFYVSELVKERWANRKGSADV